MNADLPALPVCKASPALKVPLVLLVPKVNVVSLEPRVNKVTLVPSVILVSLARLVFKDWSDLRVLAVNLATRVTKV